MTSALERAPLRLRYLGSTCSAGIGLAVGSNDLHSRKSRLVARGHASVMAMQAVEHVYCQKPLTHGIREPRLLAGNSLEVDNLQSFTAFRQFLHNVVANIGVGDVQPLKVR